MDRAGLARLLGAETAAAAEARAVQVVEEREPERFMSAFAAAVAAGGEVFLADPAWGVSERAELRGLLRRGEGGAGAEAAGGGRGPRIGRGWLMIPSGGSSGKLKFARHDEETVAAAVRGFGAHFGFGRVNAIGALPLHHVSGLMAWMRCALSGGEYRAWDWKRLEAGEMPVRSEGDWVISLVPTQLQRLLTKEEAAEWLRTFRVIFVGGGPVWKELADAAQAEGLRISLSYGMTETAAMVTALRPEEFAAGVRSSGGVLAHARVDITGDGRVRVGGESLFRGYYPAWSDAREFTTEDLGEIDARGHLHVLGRRDAVIITGGKKVQPAAVEAALRASGEFADVAVIGVPDAEWGESVVACFPAATPATGRTPDFARAVEGLAAWERPKRFVAVTEWPRTALGKVNREVLRAAAARVCGVGEGGGG